MIHCILRDESHYQKLLYLNVPFNFNLLIQNVFMNNLVILYLLNFYMHLCWALSLPKYTDTSFFCVDILSIPILSLPILLNSLLPPKNSQPPSNYHLFSESLQVEIFNPDFHPDIQTSVRNYIMDICFGGSHGQVKFKVSKKNALASHWTYFFCILLVGRPIIRLVTEVQT